MNDLMPIHLQEDGVQTVNARDLHTFLGAGQRFNDWIKRRVEKFGFEEGVDFTVLKKEYSDIIEQIDYFLSLPMAKELCMVENSDKGREARLYFIECERRAKSPVNLDALFADPNTILRLASNWKEEREKRLALEAQAEQDKPKVLFADSVATAANSVLIRELAIILKQNGHDIGQNRLFNWLRDNGYLVSSGSSRNTPTQRAMDLGLFEVKVSVVTSPSGTILETRTTKVTGKGQVYFVNKFHELYSLVAA